MSQTVAAFMLDRLTAVGRHPYLRLPGRRHQRAARRVPRVRGRHRVHPDPPRGDRRVRRLRAREVHRRGRGVHGHLRARRDPPAQRPLRRQARPRSRWWRSSASRPAWRSAPTSSRRSTSPPCSRTWPASSCRCAWSPSRPRHLIDRAMRIAKATRSPTCVIVPNDIQEAEYSEPPRAHGAVPSSVGFLEPRDRPPRRRPAARRRHPERRASRWRCWSARARSAPSEEVLQVAELLGAGVAKALNGRAAAARRAARSSPARSACSAPSRPTT